MQNPVTDKDILIPHTGRHDDKFRDIRAKAKKDEKERHLKAKRDKSKRALVPKYSIGEEVDLVTGFNKRYYYLAEVIDFEERSGFKYYGILKRTTDPEKINRIGRLVDFTESGWFREMYPANVANEKIKWTVIGE